MVEIREIYGVNGHRSLRPVWFDDVAQAQWGALCFAGVGFSVLFCVCCFITVTKLEVTACSSSPITTSTLCLIRSVFFLFCHVESNNMKPHTLPPGGTSSSSTSLPVIFDTQTHTPSLLFHWQQTSFFLASLTLTDAHILVFSHLFPNSRLVCSSCPPPALSVFSPPLSCSNAWRFNAMNVSRDRCYGTAGVCVRVWGLFHISFHIISNRELVKWSNTCLSWARRSIFQTPTETDRQTDKSERAEMRERINLSLEWLSAAGETETNDCGGKKMWKKSWDMVLKRKMIVLKSRSKTHWS